MTNHLKQKQQKQQKSLLSVLELFVGNKNGLTCIFLFLLFNSLPYVAADGDTHSPPPIYGLAANFNPSMGIILVVFISAFFFMGFFSIYIRQCSQPRVSINPDGVHGGASRRGNRGLDAAVIETFPTFPYSYVKDHKLGKGALECAVCLTEFEDADKIRLLPKCDHAFHSDCIDVWFSKRTTCPVCRANFAPVQDETPTTIAPVRDIETGDPDLEIPLSDPANEQHSVHGTDEEPLVVPVAPDVINQISMQKRPVRSGSTKPRFTGRFPRSHSTGHSLVQPGEDLERFTLRLPEDVRKQIMNMSHLNRTSVHLNRTRSMMVIFQRLGSSRKGYRTTGEGSSRGRRSVATGEGSSRGRKPEGWVLSMTPPFFARAASSSSSCGSPKTTTEPFTSVTPRAGSLRSPLGARTNPDGTELSSTRPPI